MTLLADGPADGHKPPPSYGDAINDLLVMESREFNDIVDRDIRSDVNLEEVYSEALRSPDVCERWYQCLVRMKKSTEMTIAAKGADDKALRLQLLSRIAKVKARLREDTHFASTDEQRVAVARHEAQLASLEQRVLNEREKYLRWKAGAIRFLTGVEEVMTEGNYLRRLHFGELYQGQLANERDRVGALAQALAIAIKQHREDYKQNNELDDASDGDRALWDAIDGMVL